MTRIYDRKDRKSMAHHISPLLLIVLLMAGLCMPIRTQAELVDQVIAVVNQEVITQSELDRAMVPYLAELRGLSSDAERATRLKQLQAKTLEELVNNKLLQGKLETSKILVTDNDVLHFVNTFLSERHLSLADLKADLAKNSLSFEAYKENVRDHLRRQRFLDREVRPQVRILDADLMDYYTQHASQYQGSREMRFSQILLNVRPDRGPEQTTALAKSLYQKLSAKTLSFAEAARVHSDGAYATEGGMSGWLDVKDLDPNLVHVLNQLPLKRVSEPIPLQNGVLLLQVDERRSPYTRPFEEVQREIENALFSVKMESALAQYLATLRKGAYIQMMN